MRRALALLGLLLTSSVYAKEITITFLHTNDMHAHVEPTKTRDWTLGGYARQATLIKQRRAIDPNVLLVNAGDTFQGTLFFNVYQGLADLAFMNAVGYQVMALGNHEFDKGTGVLADFVKRANFPIICANLDLSGDAPLKDLVKPSTVLSVGGEKVGFVSAIVNSLDTISSPGPTVKQRNMVTSVQAEIDRLLAQGINKIVLLSHIGYQEDRELVQQLKGVDVVIGGHSHTPLGKLGIPKIETRGDYPTLARDASGRQVLIVQAWDWGKLLGRLKVTFDAKGEVKKFEGQPIPVDDKIAEDPTIASMVSAFLKPIEATKNAPIGELAVQLNRDAMGQFIADGMLAATTKAGSVAAFMNTGGVRASLEAGAITYGDLIGVQPFANTLVTLEVTGAELRAAMEHSTKSGGSILIPSRGFKVLIEGGKVDRIEIGGKAITETGIYKITLNSFVATGGDGFAMFKDAKGARYDTGTVDLDATIEYFKSRVPVRFNAEDRVIRPKFSLL